MADRFEDRRYMSREDVAEPPRPAAAAAPKEGDPLAELAKLIGQTDPFANFGRANPTHPLRRDAATRGSDSGRAGEDTDEYFDREIFDEAPPPPAWVQHRTETLAGTDPVDPDDLSNRPHPLRRFNTSADGATGEPNAQYADGQYQDAHYGDDAPFQHPGYQNTPYDYPDDYADNPGAAREKSRRGLVTVAAVLGLAIIGTGGAFAYRTFVSGPRSGEVPVIKADPNPIKVVPPTTAEAANKAIQDRIGGATSETVIPREEQPVDVRDPTKAAARPPGGNFTARAPSSGAVPVPAPTGALPVPGEEPRKVRTFTVKGDQNEPSGNPAAKQAARAPAAPTPSPAPRPTPPAPGPVANLAPPSSAPLSLNPRANLPTPPPQSSGGYVVQVSSQRSESDAQASYRALQAKFPSVLGSRSASIKRAELGEKGTYYRAVLGPFSSPEDAAALCSNLKSAGGQCVVQRN